MSIRIVTEEHSTVKFFLDGDADGNNHVYVTLKNGCLEIIGQRSVSVDPRTGNCLEIRLKGAQS